MSSAPTLDYDRPMAPGTVRITRAGSGISIRIAPDTAKRTIVNALPAALMAAGAFALASWGLFLGQTIASGGILLLLLAIGGGIAMRRIIRSSADPIIFTADASMLRIQNALDIPPDRIIGVFEIATLTLRPITLITENHCLEVTTRKLPDRESKRIVLLVSPSFETLDHLGRSLSRAMGLPAPVKDGTGWKSTAP
jgi:hypothetical protein